MSKSSIVFGLLFSLGVHALVFWPQLRRAHEATDVSARTEELPESDAEDRVAVRVMPVPVPMAAKQEPTLEQPAQDAIAPPPPAPQEPQEVVVAPPPVQPEPDPRPQPEEPPTGPQPIDDALPGLQDIVEPLPPAASEPLVERSETSEDDEATLPTLRIEWRSPRQLKSVARALGLRVIAVDEANDIVGEVSMLGSPSLQTFNGQLSSYSNRVRTLARDYFGPAARWPGGDRVDALWILVPADVDRHFIDVQRGAIQEAGRTIGEVRVTEGRFEASGNSYRLVITGII